MYTYQLSIQYNNMTAETNFMLYLSTFLAIEWGTMRKNVPLTLVSIQIRWGIVNRVKEKKNKYIHIYFIRIEKPLK